MENTAQHKAPVFEIPASVLKTIDFEEIQSTFHDMHEMGLSEPPFRCFYIRCLLGPLIEAVTFDVRKVNKGLSDLSLETMPEWLRNRANNFVVTEYEFQFSETGSFSKFRSFMTVGEGKSAIPWALIAQMPEELCNSMNTFIYKILTVLLATKNCERKTVENTSRAKSKKARDDAKYYSTTTYISIGRITETCRRDGSSRGPVRAHLRRGHIRQQRHGKGMQEIKEVFIAPVFVNADREWIADRKKYKLVA